MRLASSIIVIPALAVLVSAASIVSRQADDCSSDPTVQAEAQKMLDTYKDFGGPEDAKVDDPDYIQWLQQNDDVYNTDVMACLDAKNSGNPADSQSSSSTASPSSSSATSSNTPSPSSVASSATQSSATASRSSSSGSARPSGSSTPTQNASASASASQSGDPNGAVRYTDMHGHTGLIVLVGMIWGTFTVVL